jgi:hypothetical protein
MWYLEEAHVVEVNPERGGTKVVQRAPPPPTFFPPSHSHPCAMGNDDRSCHQCLPTNGGNKPNHKWQWHDDGTNHG